MAITNLFTSTFDIRQFLPAVLTIVLCCHAVAVASENDRQGDPIEIIQLSVLDQSNTVQIVFKLRDDISEGQVLYHRFEIDAFGNYIFQPLDEEDYEELSPFSLADYDHVFYYVDENIPADIAPPYVYYLAFNFPDIGTPDAQTQIHGTVLLDDTPGFDFCNREVTLEWSDYKIWSFSNPPPDGDTEPLPFNYYQIDYEFGGDRSAAFVSINETSRIVELVGPGQQIFRVKAVEFADIDEPGRYAYSNSIDEVYSWPELESTIMTKVDVADESTVELTIETDGDHADYIFRFERKRVDGVFEDVDGEVSNPGDEVFTFTDTEVDGLDEGIWYYMVRAHLTDVTVECPEPDVVSGPVSTLWLGVEIQAQTENQLAFNVFYDRDPEADGYTLQQMLPGEENFTDIPDPVPPSPFTHDLSGELPLAGELRFRMKGEEAGEEFHSNEVVISIDPEINIPNAFRPQVGLPENRTFKPRFVGFAPEYTITIYDRNGLEIFSSDHSHDAEWDGTIHGPNGRPASEGGYIYRIRYTSGIHGIESGEKHGVVYLVR